MARVFKLTTTARLKNARRNCAIGRGFMICTDLTSQGASAGKHSCHPRPDQIVKFLKTIGQTLAARRERRPQSGPGPAHPLLNMLLPGMFGASGRLANPTMLAKVVPPGTRLAIAATPENGFDHVKPLEAKPRPHRRVHGCAKWRTRSRRRSTTSTLNTISDRCPLSLRMARLTGYVFKCPSLTQR